MSSGKEIMTSQKHLHNQCEKIWSDVNQVHTDLSKLKPLGTLSSAESQILEVSKAKEKQLAGELHVLKNTPLEAYPVDTNTLRVLLQEELETSTAQLQQTLDVIQAQRKELEEELNRERSLLEQHKQVHQSLVQKLEAAKDASQEQHDSDRSLRELTRKRQRAVEIQQELMRNLAKFATLHFPLPSTADVNKASKRRRSSTESDDEQHRYISLLEILEILMNKCTDDEPDPYITLDESFWPPYVELLLRCGIALRHPQACQRIKLVPFHL
ncbi:centromere protein K-like isoform X2 [Acanthaster planci]|nr:centromere protein K-like isoform X2 [Acanthaster planci]XP_022097386.1 centromere protein K-like isoform X2 [Acanthaster planci]XP_022097394.1 centromere protein K-like isoform X2 [Acanthaster planci]XP_022097403.1 centromere protein K-like isoform X2 [Acanthaster planci]